MTKQTSLETITIEGMAYGGDGFGRSADGKMLFVPHTAPGDTITCEPLEEHARWAKAALVDVLEPASERTTPRCPHYGECGGCHYQHLTYPAQLAIKTDIVRSQLRRIGNIPEPPVLAAIPSSTPWHTRNQLQFHQDAEGRLGYHRTGSNQVLPVETCLLPQDVIAELWPRLELDPLPGVKRIAIRADSDENAMIVFHSRTPADVEMHMDAPASVAWVSSRGTQILGGEDRLRYRVRERDFLVSPASFFQANSNMIETLVAQVFSLLNLQPGETLFDLYAGVGLFSAFAAEAGAIVVAVESSPAAAEDFALNLDEFDTVSLYQANTALALSEIPGRADAFVLDPPRAGMSREARQALINLSPPRMVYISCDTATFARDARRLIEAGYALRSVQPLDLFPQTFHIEQISYWEKSEG